MKISKLDLIVLYMQEYWHVLGVIRDRVPKLTLFLHGLDHLELCCAIPACFGQRRQT